MIHDMSTLDTDKKVIGYMLTWTTYGTWLQGHKKGYVKDGIKLSQNERLESANKFLQKHDTVRLNSSQKRVVKDAIIKEAKRIGQKLVSVSVYSNHVHICTYYGNESIESAASRYKNVSTRELKKTGLTGRIWTRGFYKTFCFSEYVLKNTGLYVHRHTKND